MQQWLSKLLREVYLLLGDPSTLFLLEEVIGQFILIDLDEVGFILGFAEPYWEVMWKGFFGERGIVM